MLRDVLRRAHVLRGQVPNSTATSASRLGPTPPTPPEPPPVPLQCDGAFPRHAGAQVFCPNVKLKAWHGGARQTFDPNLGFKFDMWGRFRFLHFAGSFSRLQAVSRASLPACKNSLQTVTKTKRSQISRETACKAFARILKDSHRVVPLVSSARFDFLPTPNFILRERALQVFFGVDGRDMLLLFGRLLEIQPLRRIHPRGTRTRW